MYDIAKVAGVLPIHDISLLAFYVLTGFYLLFTAVMYFHWNEYSVSPAVSRITAITYLVITLPLVTVMGLATFAI